MSPQNMDKTYPRLCTMDKLNETGKDANTIRVNISTPSLDQTPKEVHVVSDDSGNAFYIFICQLIIKSFIN